MSKTRTCCHRLRLKRILDLVYCEFFGSKAAGRLLNPPKPWAAKPRDVVRLPPGLLSGSPICNACLYSVCHNRLTLLLCAINAAWEVNLQEQRTGHSAKTSEQMSVPNTFTKHVQGNCHACISRTTASRWVRSQACNRKHHLLSEHGFAC